MAGLSIPRALTIAGSDSGGGAGIQADLKTFMAFGVFGMSALTAITAQNTLGVQQTHELPVDLVQAQIESVVKDIGVDAAKTGMLSSARIVKAVAESVRDLGITNLVVDPVMVAKGGHPLLSPDACRAVIAHLLPLALVVTPNLHEAAALTGIEMTDEASMRKAAKALRAMGPRYAVVKGGHLSGSPDAVDVVYDGKRFVELREPRYETRNTHGTGCTFSAAIAAGLAQGRPVIQAIEQAKLYVTEAIRTSLPLGSGHGPTNHLAGVTSVWAR